LVTLRIINCKYKR